MSDSPFLTVPSLGNSPTRPQRSPSQRFPPTVLFQGSSGRDASHGESSPSHHDHPSFQRLPRAQAPPSLAGASVRPSVTKSKTAADLDAPFDTPSTSNHPLSRYVSAANVKNRSDGADGAFHPDALWAEMQRTLADVELSALNTSTSSHIFGAAHTRALEDLRAAQLGLAQAWACSEADEIGHDSKQGSDDSDSDFGIHSSDVVGKATRLTSSPQHSKMAGNTNTPSPQIPSNKGRRRTSSVTSEAARDLEAETARDINLARKRREANDRYFQQVNRGVLDVVAELDKVAGAMRSVEREAREIWEERGGNSSASEGVLSDTTTGTEAAKSARKSTASEDVLDDLDGGSLERMLAKTSPTGTSVTGGFSDVLTDSPVTPKRTTPKSNKGT